jgi:retron-type reverse transcriptase
MSTKLARIAEIARERPEERFTTLAHLLDEEMLKQCHAELKKGKALGIDQVSKEEYEANLETNIADLVARLKRKAYRPQPVRRVYIPKPGTDQKRPLGIPLEG